jgi:hypothetical protein
MVNSLLDDVNELLRLSYGEENRLQDIKRRLEDGLTVYNSDINYLKKLVEQHKDEIQETAESESTTTEPEPLPVDDELEELEEEKTQEKHSGGNLKKMGFVILATAAVISVFFAIGSLEEKGWIGSDESTKTTIKEQPKVTTPKVNPFSQMTDSELSAKAVDWNYRDILRNIDYYENNIIFVDGTVTKIHRDFNSINLCINAGKYYCDDFIFVKVDENKWLEDDKLSGFVEVNRLEETGTANKFADGEWVGSGNYVPRVSEIRLTCSNC